MGNSSSAIVQKGRKGSGSGGSMSTATGRPVTPRGDKGRRGASTGDLQARNGHEEESDPKATASQSNIKRPPKASKSPKNGSSGKSTSASMSSYDAPKSFGTDTSVESSSESLRLGSPKPTKPGRKGRHSPKVEAAGEGSKHKKKSNSSSALKDRPLAKANSSSPEKEKGHARTASQTNPSDEGNEKKRRETVSAVNGGAGSDQQQKEQKEQKERPSTMGSLLKGAKAVEEAISAKVAGKYPEFYLSQAEWPLDFSASQLNAATSGYQKLLGEGGFGSVYKGFFTDLDKQKAVPVAVKVMKSDDFVASKEELVKEIVTVAKLNHPNILGLFGFCFDGEVCALVYEFMPGGDVDQLLCKCREGEAEFPWEKRVNLASRCAQALARMHQQGFVHRDFKASNVLLDKHMEPRVADFGLVKSMEGWQASHASTGVKGSMGYIDPMYYSLGHVHPKSDVYSFGVFLIELISGKSVYQDTIHQTIIPELTSKERVNNAFVRTILDPKIPQETDILKQAKGLAELARHALKERWEGRPTMENVVSVIGRLPGRQPQA